ncbi:MAG TPA: M23/M56 family metallopeptidase [Gemmatimonadota bacterium]|nr:M23/M56 family metallopeptidase [Gemmatimonadota bacterium]
MIGEPLAVASEVAATWVRLVGWEVLYSAVLFVIVLGLTRVLRESSPVLRHAVWGLVLLRLVLPVDLASPVSLGSLAARSFPVKSMRETWPVGAGSALEMEHAVFPVEGRKVGDAGPPAWPLALAIVWLVGATATGASLYRRRRGYRRIVRQASPLATVPIRVLLERWRHELGIRRQVAVVTSAALHSPFTIGSLRPVVFLPQAVVEHDEPGVVESVIAHELAHIKRWDDLVLGLQLAVSVLYFFNPVAWLSAGRMHEASEYACDRLVIAGRMNPRQYARGIVTVLRLGLTGGPSLTPALGGGMPKMRARLETIMKGVPESLYDRRTRLTLPAIVVLGLFLLPMASATGDGAQEIGAAAVAVQQVNAPVLANPLPGSRVSARFGPMIDPFNGGKADHKGIDLVGAPGAEVLAPADGLVQVATEEYSGGPAYGTVVILDHGGGLTTHYYHLGGLSVSDGERVSSGEPIGIQGATGRTTGPHVHFEVRVDGEPRDPALYVADWATQTERRSNRL